MPELEIFEDFVNSAIVRIRKPDHAIYRLAAERLGVRPQQCAFLDDLEVNCEAARAVGMTAIHFIDTATATAALDGLMVSGAPEP
jgi:epoxide hydrolase-like predicted phosphatase